MGYSRGACRARAGSRRAPEPFPYRTGIRPLSARAAGCIHCLVDRHSEVLNACFADEHVKAMKMSTINANDALWFSPALY